MLAHSDSGYLSFEADTILPQKTTSLTPPLPKQPPPPIRPCGRNDKA